MNVAFDRLSDVDMFCLGLCRMEFDIWSSELRFISYRSDITLILFERQMEFNRILKNLSSTNNRPMI